MGSVKQWQDCWRFVGHMARERGMDKKERKARHSIIEEHLKEHSEARRATPRPATTKHNKKEQKSVGFNTGPEGARCGEQQRKTTRVNKGTGHSEAKRAEKAARQTQGPHSGQTGARNKETRQGIITMRRGAKRATPRPATKHKARRERKKDEEGWGPHGGQKDHAGVSNKDAKDIPLDDPIGHATSTNSARNSSCSCAREDGSVGEKLQWIHGCTIFRQTRNPK